MWLGFLLHFHSSLATGWWRELPTEGAGFDVWDTLLPARLGYDTTPLSKAVMTVLFSSQPFFINKPRFEIGNMEHPLLCDLVILTSHNLTQPDFDCRMSDPLPSPGSVFPAFGNVSESASLYDAFRQAYASWQPGMCHLNIQTPMSSALQSDPSFNVDISREYRAMERYRAALILSELGLQNKLRHSSGGASPVIYMDRATIPTNKFYTPRELLHLLNDESESWASAVIAQESQVSHRDIAFAATTSATCSEDRQYLSEGSFFFRPSRAAAALFATMLHLSHVSMLKDATGELAFSPNATGELASSPNVNNHHLLLLEKAIDLLTYDEAGGFRKDLESICARSGTWQRSDSDTSMSLPNHLLTKRIRPELIAEISEGVGVRAVFYSESQCLKKNAGAGHEPRYFSLMPPRWLAGPACPWHLLANETSNVWHPTDFAAHFQGCEGVGHFTDLWRAAIDEDILPWIDEDEDWPLWRNQSVLYWRSGPSGHVNYLLSPPCPSA